MAEVAVDDPLHSAKLVIEMLFAAFRELVPQPRGCIIDHVLGSCTIVLAGLIAGSPISVVLRAGGGCSSPMRNASASNASQTTGLVPRVMFSAAASLIAEDKVGWALHHVQGLIAIAETSLVCSRPIGIPQCRGTLLRMAANAYFLIPRGMC